MVGDNSPEHSLTSDGQFSLNASDLSCFALSILTSVEVRASVQSGPLPRRAKGSRRGARRFPSARAQYHFVFDSALGASPSSLPPHPRAEFNGMPVRENIQVSVGYGFTLLREGLAAHFRYIEDEQGSFVVLAQFRQRQTSVQSPDAEKNLLDGFCASRSAGGFPATVLVGFWCDDSHRLHRLVGRLP